MRSFLCVSICVLAAGACSEAPAADYLRQWRPEDHGQPAEVDPARVPSEAQPAQAAQPADPARAAQALWKVACAGCHGADGRGAGASLPPGASVPNFADAAWQADRSDTAIADVIRGGRNLMPAFGAQITDDGIAALVAHIRSLP